MIRRRLRIVAGELKGRRIDLPPGTRLRPTADRVREALFAILGESVRGARVLDAYCGSGALGLEALSRGAVRVVFIESEAGAVAALARTVERFGVAGRCEIRAGGAVELLEGGIVKGPFDLVLADPPYGIGEPGRFLPAVRRRLAPGGTIVVERDRRDLAAASGEKLACHRTAEYGRTCLDFYRGLG